VEYLDVVSEAAPIHDARSCGGSAMHDIIVFYGIDSIMSMTPQEVLDKAAAE
jgi:hypothetical protein